jgi:hypothetical protein
MSNESRTHYTIEAAGEMKQEADDLRFKYYKLTMALQSLSARLKSDRARELMQHGVSRRLMLLHRCVDIIFDLFPPDRVDKLTDDDRLNVEIALHAFLINVYGVIENTGLAIGYENELIAVNGKDGIHPNNANLFKAGYQKLLNPALREYLTTTEIRSWYKDYAKNYRDAFAHRVPPYVPPSALNDDEAREFSEIDRKLQQLFPQHKYDEIEKLQERQRSLGRSNPLFVHSFSENAVPLYLHPQVLADFNTIEQLLNIAMKNFLVSGPSEDTAEI